MSSTTRQIISTENAAKPIAPFKFVKININYKAIIEKFSRFSQAIVVNQTVYLSGCIGINKDTSKLVDGGIVPETVQTLENIKAVLKAAGSGIEKVVKTTIFVEDMGDFGKVNEEYMRGINI